MTARVVLAKNTLECYILSCFCCFFRGQLLVLVILLGVYSDLKEKLKRDNLELVFFKSCWTYFTHPSKFWEKKCHGNL